MTASILPSNLKDLERDLDVALARIGEVDIPISVLWDPWLCPLDVLAYLAWAVSVDQWRSDWSEQVKRTVVAQSRAVHRIKGTRPAVEKALSAFRVTSTLTEWFEAVPPMPPGTFAVDLEIEDQGINLATQQTLEREIISVKPVRAHFTTRLIGKTRAGYFMSCATFSGEATEVLPFTLTETQAPTAVPLYAVGFWDYMDTTIYPLGATL